MKDLRHKTFLFLFILTPILVPMISNLVTMMFFNYVSVFSLEIILLITIIETFLFLPILVLFFLEKEIIKIKPLALKMILNTISYICIVIVLFEIIGVLEKNFYFTVLMFSTVLWMVVNYNLYEFSKRKKEQNLKKIVILRKKCQ